MIVILMIGVEDLKMDEKYGAFLIDRNSSAPLETKTAGGKTFIQ